MFKFDWDFEPVKVSGDAQQKISDIHNRLKEAFNIDNSSSKKLYEFYPVFKSISLDESNRIWIKHYKPYWRDRPVSETGFDVFSSEGKYLFSTKVEGNAYPELVWKNGYVYSLVEDKTGFAKAVRYKLVED